MGCQEGHRCQDQGCHQGSQEGTGEGQEGWQEGCQETETQGREGCYPLQGDRPCQACAGRGERYQEGCQLWCRICPSSVPQARRCVPRGCPGKCRHWCSPLIVTSFRTALISGTRVYNRVLCV